MVMESISSDYQLMTVVLVSGEKRPEIDKNDAIAYCP
jgi:hypothetical protein